ncbi:MAG: hypothetical protein ABI887_02790 [Burkholderiales bacterium]
MESVTAWRAGRALALSLLVTLSLAACGGGGGTGNEKDSGTNKTYLSVDVSDADGDALTYQWRVTSGSIENRNAKDTVWTMPDGPGLHFAYVTVSDGKGGYVEQQYAVSSDTLNTAAPVPTARSYAAPAVTEPEGLTTRLRFISGLNTDFGTGTAALRYVYLPDVQVMVTDPGGVVVYSGVSDLSGEVKLPKLPALAGALKYKVQCAAAPEAPLVDCATFGVTTVAAIPPVISPPADATKNLRLFGHVALADGAVCGAQNDYFSIQSAATVQVQSKDGTALSRPVHVNRFGDYAIDASVPVTGELQLAVQCEGYRATVAVDAAGAGGYSAATPIRLPHVVANHRPQIVKMVATGPEGNVRGKMIVAEAGASSNGQPGPDRFLTYKGQDTRLSVCQYYRALGAVAPTSCADAQGTMIDPISFDDWKRLNGFKPTGAGTEVAANYVNKRDLNLVRRMVATKTDDSHIAFYVCNHPGPLGTSQQEVDDLLASGLNDEKRIACVAMEWSVTAGVNGGKPFTKFYTFAPSGALLASVNLDGRGEKYLPGACVACHGGSNYNGKFPEKGVPSPYLGANFLPFDTGNYLFSSDAALTEAAQSASFYGLNQLVRQTETADDTATSNLVKGWYGVGAAATTTLNKAYVPQAWNDLALVAGYADAPLFYQEVVATSCRTCHTSLGDQFDWDSRTGNFINVDFKLKPRFCGGDQDLAINATMPNALITHDRLFERARIDSHFADMMTKYLGCSAPLPDPVYPQR